MAASKPTTLKDFISWDLAQLANILRPTEENNRIIRERVASIAELLKQQLRPVKVIKGGSYGKGTNLGDRKEVDIVVILPGYIPNEKNCAEKILQLKDCVRKLWNIEPTEADYYQQ